VESLEIYYEEAPDQDELAFLAIAELDMKKMLIGLPFLTGMTDDGYDVVGLTLEEVKVLRNHLDKFIELTEVRH
tara:strand:+ start:264 stop:485 length:222 start_codon:yes stop_codon:yes gene_type:complete